MKKNIFLSCLCLSTALCTVTLPSWAMEEEDNKIHIQKQKKKRPSLSEEDNVNLDIMSVFPEQEGKTLSDLPPAIIGKIGDELGELKDVHSLKATCRRTRAYVEVYSSYKLVATPETRLQVLKQRLQNDDLKRFLRLLTHMTPLELRESTSTLLVTAKTNFDYRNAESLQEQQITKEAFHKQTTLLKFMATYGSEKQREEARNLLFQHMQALWKLVNPKQDKEKNHFWLTLIGQMGQIEDKIKVHQWCHDNRGYAGQKQIWFEKIEQGASKGGALDKLCLMNLYEKGTCGFPKNEEKAAYWMMKASDLVPHSSFDQVVEFFKQYVPSTSMRKGILSYWLEGLDKKAKEGTMEDKRNLAYLYEQLKMPQCQKEWLESLYIQARHGGLDDMRELASWYQEGHCYLPKDPEQAKYWQEEMEKIVLNGRLEDKKKIAYWYAEGHYGMPYDIQGTSRKNLKKAEEWFKKIAHQGTQEDKLFVAFAYSFGKMLNLVPHNLKEANYWYEEAFKDQPPRQDGLTLESSKNFIDILLIADPQETFELKEKLAELISPSQGLGHPHAQYYWALKCLHEKNDEKALELLQKAKKQGLREAAYRLGIYYKQLCKGLPGERLKEMIQNFTLAAQQGHPLAHSELGWLHENQQGGIRDPLTSWAQAIAHYKYAALYGVKSAYERAKNLEYLLKNSIRKRF